MTINLIRGVLHDIHDSIHAQRGGVINLEDLLGTLIELTGAVREIAKHVEALENR